jgi:adhesin transport system membrane fusion protein
LARHLQLFTIILVIVTFIVWANFAKLDEITRGEGKVVPSTEVQVIQHQEGGTVQELLVKEGDTVESGAILMRLSDVGASSELGASNARLFGLLAQIQRLQAEAEGKSVPEFTEEVMNGAPDAVKEELNSFRANKSQLDSQMSVLKSQLSQRRSEVSEINTRLADLNRVISLTRQEMDMLAPLVARGSAPKRDVLQLEQQLAQQQSEINGLRSSLPRARSAINEANARLKDIETTFRTTAQNDLTMAQIDVKAIEQQMPALQDRKTRTDIRSPVRGIVKDIRIQTDDGSGVIRPGDAIMEIVPLDDQLVVEARIRPADIAFLHPGQEATVKVTAYDFSIYGGLKGELTDISADTITDEQGESFYQIRITTDQTKISRNGEELPIIPGMVASVDILTGDKTVMEYLMKPLIKSLNQSMNER